MDKKEKLNKLSKILNKIIYYGVEVLAYLALVLFVMYFLVGCAPKEKIKQDKTSITQESTQAPKDLKIDTKTFKDSNIMIIDEKGHIQYEYYGKAYIIRDGKVTKVVVDMREDGYKK